MTLSRPVVLILTATLLVGLGLGYGIAVLTDQEPATEVVPLPTEKPEAAEQTHPLGASVRSRSGAVTTVFAVREGGLDREFDNPRPGRRWVNAEVGLCLPDDAAKPVRASDVAFKFGVQLADTTTISAASDAYGDESLIAGEKQVAPGDCLRGPVEFLVPSDAEIRYVTYATEGIVIKWRA